MSRDHFQCVRVPAMALVVGMSLVVRPLTGAETTAVLPISPMPAGGAVLAGGTNYFQPLHEELLASLRAAEKARAEAESAAKRNEELMAARLNLVEQLLRTRSEQELETIKASNRFMLAVVCVLGSLGILGILLAAWFLSRALNRVAELSAVSRSNPWPGAGPPVPALSPGEMVPGRVAPVEHSGAVILGAIDRIQKQLDALQRPAGTPPAAIDRGRAAAPQDAQPGPEQDFVREQSSKAADAAKNERLELMLGKGQALIHMNRHEEALACFEEVLALDADNLDALVKRGAALERLGRVEKAVESYDRAIALDQSLTIAYLLKGGVFNRLGRHSEAVQCFEQALRTQDKANAA